MNATAKGPRWWHGATLYQIYVRSWRDTNGDGYGDLRGRHRRPRLPGLARAWTASGCRPPCRRRTTTGATTSPTTWASTPSSAPWPTWTSSSPRPASGACGCCSTWCPTTPAPRTPGSSTPVGGRDAAHRDYYVWADPAPGRRPAEQLAGRHRALRLDPGRRQRPVLPAQLPAQPARPELVGARRPRGVPRDPAVLVRPGRGRVPHRRRPRPVQGRRAARQPAGDRRRARWTAGSACGPVYSANRPEIARRLPRLAQDRRELLAAAAAARRDLGRRPGRLASFYGHDDELQLGVQLPVRLRRLRPRAALAGGRGADAGRAAARRVPGVDARPTTTSAGSRPAGAAATSARPGSRCWCWPRCPAPPCCTTATRSAMTDVAVPPGAAPGPDDPGRGRPRAAGTGPGPRCSGTPHRPRASPPRA